MTADRKAFEAATGEGAGDCVQLAASARRGDPAALVALAAAWLHAAAAAPERIADIYDASTQGWTEEAVRPHAGKSAPHEAAPAPEPVPSAFWTAWWALLDTAPGTLGAGGVTQRTAELLAHLSTGMRDRTARSALGWTGVSEAAAQGYPPRFGLEALAACPEGSLGGAFHRLIVDNGFDLEVLDREALGLADLPHPLDYLNARILQCHDLWHLSAGYETTALHEVAISGFQLGQFGHTYSAMFLAMVLGRTALETPERAAFLLDVILSGWRHGRESPPLLGVDWPAIWSLPMAEVRSRLGLSAYASPYPADLVERLAAAA